MTALQNWIDGRYTDAVGNGTLSNFDPATGTKIGTLPDSDERDIQHAVTAAQRSFAGWSSLPVEERSSWLRSLSSGIHARMEEFAHAESVDSGKPIRRAREIEIPRAIRNLEFFADAATQFASESHTSSPDRMSYTLRSPLGVVATISPWNLPLYLLTWKIAPALAAGNTVVAKPSEVTPLTAHLLADVARSIGFPAGVLNIVHGLGSKTGDAISKHPDIRAISFTGSTATGARISSIAAPLFKKLSLEMGGKNANIIFSDADFEHSVREAVRASFSNQGQICLCGSRILVENSIYQKFRDAFVTQVKELRIGDPLLENTDQGALVSKTHHEKVLAAIQTARTEGGTILTGGNAAQISGRCKKGYFIEPTVIEGLGPEARTCQEEIFGPVVTLAPFQDEADALRQANSTRYGLAASIWTQDFNRAHRVAQAIQSGVVWINDWMARDLRTPFGGTKDSGVGREGGWEAMRFFTEPKCVSLKIRSN